MFPGHDNPICNNSQKLADKSPMMVCVMFNMQRHKHYWTLLDITGLVILDVEGKPEVFLLLL